MRVRNWYNKNKDALMGFCVLGMFVLLPATFILIGIRSDNIYDRGLSLFVGVGLAIPLVMIITSIVVTKRNSRG